MAKILVADDSLTIQKVVKITLANEPFELVECLDESALFKRLKAEQYELVLLDFNFSGAKSGYELAQEIKKVRPNCAIMAMLGTFDTVDEAALAECGIQEKIVKPFESGKFIQKCRELISGGEAAEDGVEESSEEAAVEDDGGADVLHFEKSAATEAEREPGEDWVLDSPMPVVDAGDEQNNAEDLVATSEKNPLAQEVEGWGMNAGAGTLAGEEESGPEFPPVIDAGGGLELSLEDRSILLNTGDLEWPDTSEPLSSGPKSRLISLDELASESSESVAIADADRTDPIIQAPDLRKEIANEISPEDFWAVDSQSGAAPGDINWDQAKVEVRSAETGSNTRPAALPGGQLTDADRAKIVEELKHSMRPMLEEIVRAFFHEKADQVAWEVIPDLAENLISREIKQISDALEAGGEGPETH